MTGNLFPARLRTSHQDKRKNDNYRRNGKLQACEPCRKGKLRCDHMMPTCGRCARLNKAEKCTYHPAPMTKASERPAGKSTEALRESPGVNSFSTLCSPLTERGSTSVSFDSTPHLSRPQAMNQNSLNDINITRTTTATTSELSEDFKLRASRADSASAQGVYAQQPFDELYKSLPDPRTRVDALRFDKNSGFTSSSALLAEHEIDIGILDSNLDVSSTPMITQLHIDRGAAVLTLLHDLPMFQKYIEKWFSFAAGIVVIEPMAKIFLHGLFTTWFRALENQKPADLRLMSEKIWENTLKPVSRLLNRDTAPNEFCANVTGKHLRWEVVGILVSLVSLLAQSLRDGDPIFCQQDEAPINRAALALKMHNASEMCVSFCDEIGALNDLYLWLLYENSIAYCSMRTKGNYENAKKTSRLAAALMSCNLHREIVVDNETPFFMAELRKRLFICAYENDKHAAASSGRPPRLTRQYCRLQIPYDLTDIQMMSQGLELERAVEDLDDNGWSRTGSVQRCTFARLAAASALITEEILEISLGYLQPHEIISRAEGIESEAKRYWNELPDFLQLDVSNPWSSSRSPLELLVIFCIRLNYLDHSFLLQRTLGKKVHTGLNADLLSVCSEIFQVVGLMVENKDIFRDFQVDFIQILVKHGIPAAALLAVELLRQEQDFGSATIFPLHRSDTVQSLSVFVACLGTVKSDSNGYHNCNRGRNFLKRILDIILGAGPAMSRSSASSCDSSDPTLGASLLQPTDVDFMQWLEGMAWEQETWVNFG